MRKITTITSFIQELSHMVDRGISYSIEDIHQHIENKDIIDWLEAEFPFGTERGLDLSIFKRSHRDWIHEEIESIFGGYAGRERRKWGIENNGLCLLISWSIEVVRGLFPREGDDWID